MQVRALLFLQLSSYLSSNCNDAVEWLWSSFAQGVFDCASTLLIFGFFLKMNIFLFRKFIYLLP